MKAIRVRHGRQAETIHVIQTLTLAQMCERGARNLRRRPVDGIPMPTNNCEHPNRAHTKSWPPNPGSAHYDEPIRVCTIRPYKYGTPHPSEDHQTEWPSKSTQVNSMNLCVKNQISSPQRAVSNQIFAKHREQHHSPYINMFGTVRKHCGTTQFSPNIAKIPKKPHNTCNPSKMSCDESKKRSGYTAVDTFIFQQ